MLVFDKVERTYAQIRSTTGVSEVVDKDVLFNVLKPAEARLTASREHDDLEQQVAAGVRQHLQTLPERIKTDPTKSLSE